MLADRGYDATYLTLFELADWDDVARFESVPEYGLDVAGLYYTVDVTGDDAEFRAFLDLVDDLAVCENVELALRAGDESLDASDPAGDDAAVDRLQAVLDATGDATVSLYPHFGHWMERMSDAVRLCEQVDHPRLGVAFPSFHWYGVDGVRQSRGRKRLPGRGGLYEGGRGPALVRQLVDLTAVRSLAPDATPSGALDRSAYASRSPAVSIRWSIPRRSRSWFAPSGEGTSSPTRFSRSSGSFAWSNSCLDPSSNRLNR